MPKSGDSYTIELKPSHLHWGTYRYTGTRGAVAGEAYVPIPKQYAEDYGIYVGSCYTAVFSDGFQGFVAKAAGSQHAGGVYAKQFQGDGDLKAFGYWYTALEAEEGDRVRVTFLSDSKIEFTLLKSSVSGSAERSIAKENEQKNTELENLMHKRDCIQTGEFVGASVLHKSFGAGTICSLSEGRAVIDFEGQIGTKQLAFPGAIAMDMLHLCDPSLENTAREWIVLEEEIKTLQREIRYGARK